jgi:hypothetical protein
MNTSKTPPDSKTSYAKAFFDSIDPSETSSLIASEAGWVHLQIHQCWDRLCSWMQ